MRACNLLALSAAFACVCGCDSGREPSTAGEIGAPLPGRTARIKEGSATLTETYTRTDTATETAPDTTTWTYTATSTDTGTHTGSSIATVSNSVITTATDWYNITGTVTGTVTVTAYWVSWNGTSTNTTTNTYTATAPSGPTQSTYVVTKTSTNTVTNSRNGTETKTATAATTGYVTFTGTTTVTVTNTVTTTAGFRAGSGTGTVSATGTAVQTGTASWTFYQTWTATQSGTYPNTKVVTNTGSDTSSKPITVTTTTTDTRTSTSTDTGTGTSTVTGTDTSTSTGTGTCLQDWRNTQCGNWCARETDQPRSDCQTILDCYLNHGCSPITCGSADDTCGRTKLGLSEIAKTIADQVYACLPCPGNGPISSCNDPLVPDTTPCTDNDLCTVDKVCMGGECIGTPKPPCPDPDQCHQSVVCDSTTGLCPDVPVDDGTGCNAGDRCTENDTCVGGTCQKGSQVSCDDGSDCTEDTCDSSKGCVHKSKCDADKQTCYQNKCCDLHRCIPELKAECGTFSNNCGSMVSCGTCPSSGTCNAVGRCIPNGFNQPMGVNVCEMLLEDLIIDPLYGWLPTCDPGTWDWKCATSPDCCSSKLCLLNPFCYGSKKVWGIVKQGATILAGNVYCSVGWVTPVKFFEDLMNGQIRDLDQFVATGINQGFDPGLIEFHEWNLQLLEATGRNIPANGQDALWNLTAPYLGQGDSAHWTKSDMQNIKIVSSDAPTASVYYKPSGNATGITLGPVIILRSDLYNALFDSANSDITSDEMLTSTYQGDGACAFTDPSGGADRKIPMTYSRAIETLMHELVHVKQYRNLGETAYLGNFILGTVAGSVAVNPSELEPVTLTVQVAMGQRGCYCHAVQGLINQVIDDYHTSDPDVNCDL